MGNEEILSDYMRAYYSDEKLAALLAHAEDGKLSYWSCCCFIGIPTADHALRGEMNSATASIEPHYIAACSLEAEEAENAFINLGFADERNPKALPMFIELVRAEMKRREEIALATSAELIFQETH